MINQDTSIETLQTQVRQVTIDIDAVKSETSDTLKKLKAEAAVNKIKSTKEEITKKLEVLNKLTDANAKADVAKLEAMLVTLESFSELNALKISVVSPIEMPKNNETIDNTADIGNITTGMEIMKTMIMELQSSIDGYIAQKATMSEIDKTNKEKEIEEKKIAIEVKRKEIQTSIDKIKKVRSEFKLEDITDETLKAAMKTQKETEEKNIADQQKQLNALVNPATTFFEKVKNGVSKTWEKVKEWASKTRERAKENPKTAIAATAWIGLLIRWISKLFKKRKKNKEKDEGGEKKGFRDRWYGKALKRGFIGTWAARLLRWLFGGKRDIFGLWTDTNNPKTPIGPETSPGAPNAAEEAKESLAEKIPEIKQAYNEIALNINDYYANMYGEENVSWATEDDMLGESEFEKKWTESIPGTIVFMLDNRYATIGDMINEKAFARELIGSDINKLLDGRRNRSADEIKKFLAPIASKFDAKTRWLISAAKGVDDIANAIKGKPGAEKIITMVFRKSMKVISYMQNRKRALERELVKEKLQSDNKEWFNDKKLEDQEEAIDQYLKDPKHAESVNADVTALFMSKRMVDFQDEKLGACWYQVLKDKNLIEAKIAPEVEEDIKDLDKEKDELLDKEDDGSDKLSDIKEKIKDWKLETQDQNNLEEFCEDFTEIMETSWKNTYLNKYFFLLEMFNTEADTWEKIYESSEYKTFVEAVKKGIQEILKKSKDWTLTEGDIDTLRADVDDYYIYQKELTNATYEIHQSRNNDDDVFDIIIARSVLVLRKGVMNFKEWAQLLFKGKTSGEHIKWWAIIVWNVAAVSLIRHPLQGAKKLLKLGAWTVQKWFNITEQLTGKTIRSSLPRWRGARWYNETTLNYAVSKWDISLENAMQVARKKEWRVWIWPNAPYIKTQEQLLERLFPNRKDYAQLKVLLNKYKNNKYVMRELVGMKYNGKRLNPKDRLKLNKVKMTFEINPDVFTKLQNIEVRIAWLKTQTEKDIFQTMMKYVRSIDQAEDLAIMSIDAKYLKYFESWSEQLISAEQFGKYLWKYGKKINPEQMGKLMEFFQNAKAADKFTVANKETIVLNALKNFNKIEAKGFSVEAINELKLNVSQYEKISTKVKTWVDNMINDLNKILKNPKMKSFYSSIQSKINNLTNYRKTITPESIKAINEAGRLDKIAGFGNLSPDGIRALQSLSSAIKADKTILDALSKANKIDDVKDILRNSWIAVDKIDDGVLMKIVQTKKVNKIESIINYGAEYAGVKTLKAVLKNPAMKTFGKWLWFAWVIIDVAFVWIDFVSDTTEVERIKQYNVIRWENKEAEAYFDVIVWWTWALAWAIWILALSGTVNAWNPVGRVCLAWAWAAMWVEALGDLYYGEIDKFKQNYKDFLSQSLPEIKQRLIYINSWQNELEPSFQDLWSKVTGNMWAEEKKKISMNTSADAVKSIIYFEEIQKYPYAMADLNDPEIRNNPDLENIVKQQKDLHEKAVNMRYEYIKKNYIDGKPSIVSKNVIEKNQWIQALDNILAESRICQAVENDPNYMNKTDIKWYKKYAESEIRKSNTQWFTQLENMYINNKLSFFEMVASLPYYESMLNQYPDIENYDKISANLDFFKKYANYQLMDIAISDYPTINLNHEKIDYDKITNLLSSWTLSVTTLSATETNSESIEYLTDIQINEKYNVSSNLWQNILYEIANKKHGYIGKNNLVDLKDYFREDKKTSNGIYFDPDDKDWAINENNWSDNEFATDTELNAKENIIKMRWYIDDASNSSTTGNMITENDSANKEYAKYYIDIINQNLDCRIDPKKYHKQIVDYIKLNSNGKYIQLPPDLLILWIKSGIANVGAFVYARDKDGKKLDAKSTIKWITPALITI